MRVASAVSCWHEKDWYVIGETYEGAMSADFDAQPPMSSAVAMMANLRTLTPPHGNFGRHCHSRVTGMTLTIKRRGGLVQVPKMGNHPSQTMQECVCHATT